MQLKHSAIVAGLTLALSFGAISAPAPAAPSIYAQHGNCRNHAAFHYLKDN